jgi:hypothetical protein
VVSARALDPSRAFTTMTALAPFGSALGETAKLPRAWKPAGGTGRQTLAPITSVLRRSSVSV